MWSLAVSKRLVIIAGPSGSGKHRLARHLCQRDGLLLVSRDAVRDAIFNSIDEWEITLVMEAVARKLLRFGHSVVIAAWNLDAMDHDLWSDLASTTGVDMEWLDVREPEVAALIPPMEIAV
jgi:predicted kinase